jgi:oxalate decarboxylase/phosphoglucose isomerase-like protein (cupin superfamily)
VRKHDFIFLPPGVEHAISNSGLFDLVFLAITSPGYGWHGDLPMRLPGS